MKTIKDYSDMFKVEDSYSEKLKNCYFVGDLILTRNEIMQVSSYIKPFVLNRSLIKIRSIFLVYVTNIAYFFYDERGFWKHLCTNLKVNYDDIDTGYVGSIIEKTLIDYDLISQTRYGPFRYVGTILEQTGITERHIPSFVNIVRSAIKTYNISNSYENYKRFIESTHCTKYLRDYLLDKAGWAFTIQVIKIINYVEKNLMKTHEIPNLKGFHPSFWKELFNHYGTNKFRISKGNRVINYSNKRTYFINKPVNIKFDKKPDLEIEGMEYKIFFDNIPNIYLSNSFNKQLKIPDNVLLFYDFGKGVNRIKNKEDFDNLKKEIKSVKSCMLELWVEYLDRKSEQFLKNVDKTIFCIIPNAEFELPYKIYGINEEIFFKCNSKYIHFDNCIKETNTSSYYKIPVAQKNIRGQVKLYNKSLRFTHQLNRLEVKIVGNKSLNIIDMSMENNNYKIVIKGLPNLKLSFGVVANGNFYKIIDKIKVDETGKYTLEYSSIINVINKVNPLVAIFALQYRDEIHIMNTGIFTYSNLIDDIDNIKELYSNVNYISLLNKQLKEKITLLYKAYKGNEIVIDLSNYKNDKTFITLIHLMSSLNNNIEFENIKSKSTINIVDKNINSLIKWVNNSKTVIKNNNHKKVKEQLKRYNELEWIPKTKTWSNKIDDLLNKLKQKEDYTTLINIWKEEVLSKKAKLDSKISNMKNGKQLTKAWRKYNNNEIEQSLSNLRIIDKTDKGIIYLLHNILICLVYIKKIRLNAIKKFINEVEDFNEYNKIINFFKSIYSIILKDNLVVPNTIDEAILETLPLLANDYLMIKRINVIFSNYNDSAFIEEYVNNNDWLELLIAYKLLKKNNYISDMISNNVSNLINKLPASPDKILLTKEFYKWSGLNVNE